jgi:putative ribosome biogenesis GTPase RsgA
MEAMRQETHLSEVYNRYKKAQCLFKRCRDKLLSEGDMLFVRGDMYKYQERLLAENKKLKCIIGELKVEQNKRLLKRNRTMNCKTFLSIITVSSPNASFRAIPKYSSN